MSFSNHSQGNGSWWSKLWTAGAEKRVKEIQHISDPGTIADETLQRTRDILIPISLLFSFVFCAFFYYSFLSDSYPIWVAITGALIIAFLIENGKIYYGIRAIRTLYFDRFWSTVHDTILFIGILAFSVLTFYWSIKNSTSGLHDLTSRISTEKSFREIIFKPNTADIDRQISEARKAQESAEKMRWKGKITVEGQRSIRRSEESISKLQTQRLAMIDQAQQQYNRQTTLADTNTQKSAGWTALFGGFIEVGQIILLIIAGSCEKKLSDRKASGQNQNYAPQNAVPHFNYSQPAQNGTGQFYNSSKPVGFNLDESGNVRSSAHRPPQPVNGLPTNQPETLYHNVPQEKETIGTEEVIKHYKTLLGRDIANLKNENGKKSTIAIRMHRNIIDYSRMQKKSGFEPDKILATEMFLFLEHVFSTLEEYGRPYDFSKYVLNDLRPHIDAQEYQTRKAEQARA